MKRAISVKKKKKNSERSGSWLSQFMPVDKASLFFRDENIYARLSRKARKIQIGDGRRLITAELNGDCRFGNWISYRARAELPSGGCRYLTCLRAINVLIEDKGSPCAAPSLPRAILSPRHDLYTYGLYRRCIHYLITRRQVNTNRAVMQRVCACVCRIFCFPSAMRKRDIFFPLLSKTMTTR